MFSDIIEMLGKCSDNSEEEMNDSLPEGGAGAVS